MIFSDNTLIWGCGIFAFIGDTPGKWFSWDKFNALGSFNDSRGGDACGRVVGNKVEYGLDKFKQYTDFAAENSPSILKVTQNCILGHCRKASSGGKADIYAQPVVLYKKDLDLGKIRSKTLLSLINLAGNDDIIFSGIHNGTIENYLDLAEKYKIPRENHNDSRVLLSILFYGHMKVLSEYIGTAALIWHNHLTNKTFVFKGASKSYSGSTDISEERPLFVWEISKNNYYLSSIPLSLKFIQIVKKDIHEVKVNTLYKFRDGVNYTSAKVDRSSCTQYKTYKIPASSSNYNTPALSSYRGGALFRREDYANTRRQEEQLRRYNDSIGYEEGGELLPWAQKELGFHVGENLVRQFSIGKNEPFRLAFEKVDTVSIRSVKKVSYCATRYWMNGGLLHGIYLLTQGGIVPKYIASRDQESMTKPYYFIEGIMMDGYQAYKAALKTHALFIATISDNMAFVPYEEDVFTLEIAKYSRYPIVPLLNNDDRELCYAPSNNRPLPEKNYHTGSFHAIFSERRYTIVKGELESILKCKDMKIQQHDVNDALASDVYLRETRTTFPMDWVQSVGFNLITLDTYKNPLSPLQKILFKDVNLTATKLTEIEIFMINYLRNFDYMTVCDCGLCVDEQSTFINNCSTCTKLRCNLEMLKSKTHSYGTYN